MSLVVTCTQCSQSYSAILELAGRQLPCPQCGAVMQVPVMPPIPSQWQTPTNSPGNVPGAQGSPGSWSYPSPSQPTPSWEQGQVAAHSSGSERPFPIKLFIGIASSAVALLVLVIAVSRLQQLTSSQAQANNPQSATFPPDAAAPLPGIPNSANSSSHPMKNLPSLPSANPSFPFTPTGLSVPVKFLARVETGSCGCPNLLIDNKVVEWKTGRALAELRFGAYTPSEVYFSPSGRFLAWNHAGDGLHVRDLKSNREILYIPRGREPFAFGGDEVLIVRGTDVFSLDIHPLGNPEDVRVLDLKHLAERHGVHAVKITHPDSAAASPDGKLLITAEQGTVVLLDLTTGNIVKTLLTEPGNTTFVGLSPEEDEFYHIGKGVQELKVHCWNLAGELVEEIKFPIRPIYTGAADVKCFCLPNKKGWYLLGQLCDRKSKLPVIQFSKDTGQFVIPVDGQHMLIDIVRLQGDNKNEGTKLELFEVPWNRLQPTLDAIARGEPASLGPGQPISLEVIPQGSGNNVSELQRLATEAVTARLAKRGIAIQNGAAAKLRLNRR